MMVKGPKSACSNVDSVAAFPLTMNLYRPQIEKDIDRHNQKIYLISPDMLSKMN